MTELTRFQRRLIKFQSPAFNFERASVALLTRLMQSRRPVIQAPTDNARPDPHEFRVSCQVGSKGCKHG